MPTTQRESSAFAIVTELEQIRQSCLSAEREFAETIAKACTQSKASVRNLLHYLAFRKYDLRELQPKLASMGLSSLGRAESSILAGIEAVIAMLESLSGSTPIAFSHSNDFETGPAKLRDNADQLLGPSPTRTSRADYGHPAYGSCALL